MIFLDMLAEKECWLWCQLWWEEGDDLDLKRIGVSQEDEYFRWEQEHNRLFKFDCPREIWEKHQAEEEIMRGNLGIPEWFYYEMQNEGVNGIIYNLFEYSVHDDMPSFARWGLENGIAPLQPFLLKLPRPHYSGPDREGEYDVEYYYDVMSVYPWSEEKVLEQWDRYLKYTEFNTCLTR